MEGILHTTALLERAAVHFDVDDRLAVHTDTDEPHIPGIPPS